MVYTLLGTMEWTRKNKDNLTKGLKNLIEKEIIYLIDNNGNNYVLDLITLYIDSDDTYFITTDEEIKSILSIDTKDKFSLFHYALTVLSTVWNKNKYGCNTIDDLCNMCQITKMTGLSYNKILEDNSIIFIERNEVVSRNDDGTLRQQSNTYGRFKDSKYITNASQSYNEKVFDNTKTMDANLKRSITALYKSYINGTYKGNVKKLHDDVIKYNEDRYTKFNHKELDITIFTEESLKEQEQVQEIKTKTKRPNVIKLNEQDMSDEDF
jgi:hypothetical protein